MMPLYAFTYLVTNLARPAADSGLQATCSASVSLFINDSCHNNYLKVYRADHCQIFQGW